MEEVALLEIYWAPFLLKGKLRRAYCVVSSIYVANVTTNVPNGKAIHSAWNSLRFVHIYMKGI